MLLPVGLVFSSSGSQVTPRLPLVLEGRSIGPGDELPRDQLAIGGVPFDLLGAIELVQSPRGFLIVGARTGPAPVPAM